jgi:formate dehydrogenase
VDAIAVTALLARLPRARTQLLANLGRLRGAAGRITPELSDALADHMGLRRGDVHEVVSFYSYLQLPVGTPRVCTGPICDCFGARELLAATPGAVETPCLGRCEHAPAALDASPRAWPHRTNAGTLGLDEPDATLADYETRGGLAALRTLPSPDAVLGELRASGLVGYGGAGFPAARKWEAVLAEPGERVVVVNADEGEPGTIKDRYVLERRPHLLLEGALVAARTLGARDLIIYLREEYPEARERLETAFAELAAAGLLEGLRTELAIGAGAYIAGEETALLESLEGRRAMPRLKPPYPSSAGYLGRPTLIHNVETLAHVPVILREGGAAWAARGRNGATGVRLYSITGAVARPGCYEAPNGTTLRELLELAGGATEPLGAIVPGGAASGLLPPHALDVPFTREALVEWGCAPGSAAVQVFPGRYPVLRLLEETFRFFAEESCQKCTPCRIGNRALHRLCDRLAEGEAVLDAARLDDWLDTMERTSICGLGQAAPLPLRNARRHWPELFAPLGEAVAS